MIIHSKITYSEITSITIVAFHDDLWEVEVAGHIPPVNIQTYTNSELRAALALIGADYNQLSEDLKIIKNRNNNPPAKH